MVALGKIGWPYAEDAVVDYVADRGSPEYVRALDALGCIGGQRAEAFLVALLRDGTRPLEERRAALVGLIRMRSPGALIPFGSGLGGEFGSLAELALDVVGGREAVRILHLRYRRSGSTAALHLPPVHLSYRREYLQRA